VKSRRIVPTDVEHLLRPDEYIISTANTRGRITSVNEVLVRCSGYSREELINAQHNITRHPDVPRALIWLMWESLREGEDFYGYFKNLRKDGGFYWVFAHARPEYDSEGNVCAYRSVRHAARNSAVSTIVDLYQQMLAAQHAVSAKFAIPAGLAVLRRYLSERGQSYEQFVARI
jgi:PAS domain S-box-containing protein